MHRSLADQILHWDKKQSCHNPTAIKCSVDPAHGNLQVHGSGQVLACFVKGCSQPPLAIPSDE